MPATKFVLKFSSTTGRLRSFAYLDAKAESDNNLPGVGIGPGEAVLLLPNNLRGDEESYQAIITKATGLVPTSDRYAVVDAKGQVSGWVLADPTGCGDYIPGKSLIQSDLATSGWTHNGKTFSPPQAVLSK